MSENKMTNLEKFAMSIKQLQFAITVPAGSPLYLEGTIQIFEGCFELAWKAMKEKLLSVKGVDARQPKPVLQEAFIAGWIADEKMWLKMLDDRNNTSHTYDKATADEIYEHIIGNYCRELTGMLEVLSGENG
jgi:nucleotidyltransferase substrate binding protein (TIGR01987 family)